VRIDAKTGVLALPGDEDVIVEAFKPGDAPPDNPMDVIGGAARTLDPGRGPFVPGLGGGDLPASADITVETLTTGTGGLY
jgi:hypothetical protein